MCCGGGAIQKTYNFVSSRIFSLFSSRRIQFTSVHWKKCKENAEKFKEILKWAVSKMGYIYYFLTRKLTFLRLEILSEKTGIDKKKLEKQL
jgi:hypothetical protein